MGKKNIREVESERLKRKGETEEAREKGKGE